MRICSLLPSASEIIAELGQADSLVGVSDECHWPAEVVGKPVVTAARIDTSALTSREIDSAVRASVEQGGSLYAVDAALMEELRPDLIVTQDLCAVCAVSSGDLATAFPLDVEVLSLDPRTLGGVAETFRVLARRLGTPDRGRELADEFDAKIRSVADAVHGLGRRRIFFAEWLDPPFCAGHWIPEMIPSRVERTCSAVPGAAAHTTDWDAAFEHQPELVILAAVRLRRRERRSGGPWGSASRVRPSPSTAMATATVLGRGFPTASGSSASILHPGAVEDPGLPAIVLARCGPGCGLLVLEEPEAGRLDVRVSSLDRLDDLVLELPTREAVRLPHDLLLRWAFRASVEARAKKVRGSLHQPDDEQDAGQDGDRGAPECEHDGADDEDRRRDDAGPEERLVPVLPERHALAVEPTPRCAPSGDLAVSVVIGAHPISLSLRDQSRCCHHLRLGRGAVGAKSLKISASRVSSS
jgi:iron complex transport system substrate-binding protein